MSLPARALLAVLLAFAAALWSGESHAGNRPAEACRPMSHLPGELWLGHFTGGRRVAGAGVDWRDEYACFTSRAACRAWWGSLNRTYRHVEGHGTCMALRGGGRVIVTKVVKHRTIVSARY
jgi:hypothetical protein